MKALPAVISSQLWDETSDADPCNHRVDPTSYEALFEHAAARCPGQAGFELTATLYLPVVFAGVLDIQTPIEARVASAPHAATVLCATRLPTATHAAAATLADALRDSLALRLPWSSIGDGLRPRGCPQTRDDLRQFATMVAQAHSLEHPQSSYSSLTLALSLRPERRRHVSSPLG